MTLTSQSYIETRIEALLGRWEGRWFDIAQAKRGAPAAEPSEEPLPERLHAMTLPERDGARHHLIVTHGNGMTGATHANLARALADANPNIQPWLIDTRGHGRSTLSLDPGKLRDYRRYSADLKAFCQGLEGQLHFMGHSMGALLALREASDLCAKTPERVGSLMLLEPTLLSRFYYAAATLGHYFPALMRRINPLIKPAARRRPSWETWDEMFASYEDKELFAAFDPDSFAGYLATGIKASQFGVALSCAPAVEAANFQWLELDLWGQVKRRRSIRDVPTFLAYGKLAGSTLQGSRVQELKAFFRNLTVLGVEDADHFLPMTHVDLLQQDLLRFYSGLSEQGSTD
jgi:pimeloyl-ACP methyl ester carboxylesterase